MFKLVTLLKRMDGLSMEAFKAYYEDRHAKLVQQLFPSVRKYVRNYLTPFGSEMYPAETPFDCVTEAWFDDEEAFREAAARIATPEISARIAEDEQHLFDRARILWFTVDEVETPLAPSGGPPAS